jgi:hypothetical protein
MCELGFNLGMDVAVFLGETFCGGIMMGIWRWGNPKGTAGVESVVCEE